MGGGLFDESDAGHGFFAISTLYLKGFFFDYSKLGFDWFYIGYAVGIDASNYGVDILWGFY